VTKATLIIATLLAGVPVWANPVSLLPGMPHATQALPEPLITDLTNAPNPVDIRKPGFAGQTEISYQLAQDARVSVELYDLLGRKVRGWNFASGVNGGLRGANSFVWDGTNEHGRKVTKGGYLVEIVIETPQTTVTAVRKIGVIH
jgi:hypothetical protein